MQVSWIGADTASFSAAASALWCGTPRWLEVVGQRGDTGVALVVYPSAGQARMGGVYSVRAPARDSAADSVAAVRPSGAIAVRWVTPQAVEGYEGIAGTIRITEGDQGIAGTFEGVLRSVASDDTLSLDGRFRGLPVTRDGAECQPADTTSAAGPKRPPG